MGGAATVGTAGETTVDAEPPPPRRRRPGWPRAAWSRAAWSRAVWTGRARWLGYALGQAVLMAGLFMTYRLGRRLAAGHEGRALAHARDVWQLERGFGLPSEAGLQRLALHSTTLVELANRFYMYVHFPASIVFLAWVLLRHRDQWSRVRNALIALTGAALAIHLAYPLAPPRFLSGVLPDVNIVDTGRLLGPSPYPTDGGSANQYAAMPSMHVGWAILEAWAVITILRSRARWVALAQPIVTTLVVVVTGNHYWLDGLVGAALVVGAVWITAPGRGRQMWAWLPPIASMPVPAAASASAVAAAGSAAARPVLERDRPPAGRVTAAYSAGDAVGTHASRVSAEQSAAAVRRG